MPDLIEEFFRRDLTEDEESRLLADLDSSEKTAAKFTKKAAATYSLTGLPAADQLAGGLLESGKIAAAGSATAGGAAAGSGLLVKAALAVGIAAGGGAAVWVVNHSAPPAPQPQAQAPPQEEGGMLAIRLDLGSSQAVKVRVEDGAGRLVADLGSRRLEAGSHRISWDGKDSSGNPVHAGSYTIVVDYSTGQMSRQVHIRRGPNHR